MKRTYLIASMYRENTIQIPYSRLKSFIRKGDIIRGHCKKVSTSAWYIEYKVTHVAWWGVYAVPTAKMMENLGHNKDFLARVKGHHKFKWVHIQGVIFQEEKTPQRMKFTGNKEVKDENGFYLGQFIDDIEIKKISPCFVNRKDLIGWIKLRYA